MNNTLIYRNFESADKEKVLKIYNFHIINGLANFEENPIDFNEFEIIYNKILSLRLPFIVCEKNKNIIGFAYLNTFRNKSGYRFSFENTIYIDEKHTGLGIGSELLKRLIFNASEKDHIKTIVAVIGGNNPEPSIKIHKKNGFSMIGTLKKIGFKKNTWLDVIYMQKVLNEKN